MRIIINNELFNSNLLINLHKLVFIMNFEHHRMGINKLNMKHLSYILTVVCLFGLAQIFQAQNIIPASGGNATGSGGTVSYTVGQIVYVTDTGNTGSVIQGVQQPYGSLISVMMQHL